MEHLEILSYIIILITGGAAVTYITVTHNSHQFPFLRSFLFFILFINIKTLMYLVLYYCQVNLQSDSEVFEQSALFNLAETHIIFLFFIATFSMIQTVRKLNNVSLPAIIQKILIIIASLTILFYIGQLLLTALGESQFWLRNLNIRDFYTMLFYGLNLLFLVWLLILSRKENTLSKNRINRVFGVFYLFSFAGLLSTNFIPLDWHIIIILTFKAAMNLFPIFWIRKFLLKYGRSIPLTLDETLLKTMADEHGITPREREIIDLILKGKSNNQIANQLCIAHHTVKNHLYRLYQKLGVNNRYELVTFFLNINHLRPNLLLWKK